MNVPTVLQALACLCFLFATFNVPLPKARPLNLVALGLLLWLASYVIFGHIEVDVHTHSG